VIVVKVGGAVIEDALGEVRNAVVVHGGGPQISAAMDAAGLEVSFVRGRRFTSAAAIEVVRDALLDVNAQLCAAIGPRAVGPVPELGRVGSPVPSRPQAVVDALAQGLIPVVAPLAVGPLNVNADEVAAALAIGLGADRILFLTDVPGVLRDDEVLDHIGADEVEAGCFEGGIVPKLHAAVVAAKRGVRAEIGRTLVTA
jgi:acetylglutamate kinase